MKDSQRFLERHPKLNLLFSLVLFLVMVAGSCILIRSILSWLFNTAEKAFSLLKSISTSFDAVVIVALITGTVSLVSVIISSIVSKFIEYKKNRQDYLAKKREQPYGEFVEMLYKVQQNGKKEGSYTQEQMIEDLSKFSKQITLWGSSKVVKKWVKFRENGTKPDAGKANLFLMEDIMNEMRKDLGLKKVKKGDLLAFFINDIKTAMKRK
ncbi:hypothetical protein MCG44_10730 [Lawsonibacter sp. OA9]|jgi:hypothetical protein|uniref:hypothetical protein n=1 Tax=Eubacteriales TaxID=186802 RepID=UPI000820E868|nr:hypothetical protein [Lawsonibacter sp. OA9]MCH1980211.1 hypothetical protein [Lawsonibacter sp. OA9]SCH27163.1 Uncharacterised protein [uncultured Clostridium sp.]